MPAGESLTLYVDGVETTLTETPEWGLFSLTVGQRQSVVDFGAGTLALGFTYEVRAAHVSIRGVQSGWTYATVSVDGDREAPTGVTNARYEALSGDFRLHYDLPPEADYALTTIRAVNRVVADAEPPADAVNIGAVRGG